MKQGHTQMKKIRRALPGLSAVLAVLLAIGTISANGKTPATTRPSATCIS